MSDGLYGPLIVLEPGENYDPTIDHILMIGYNGVVTPGQRQPNALNGRSTPEALVVGAGVPNRPRLINITSNNVGLTASLVNQFDLVSWKLVANDGADVATAQKTMRPARQLVSVGQTYDFELTPSGTQPLWFDLRIRLGERILHSPSR